MGWWHFRWTVLTPSNRSDIRFLARCRIYLDGQAPEDAIDDAVDAWHDSGDEETRPLSSFLGMTDDGYVVWVMDGRTLPLLRDARRAGEHLDAAVARYVHELQAMPASVNAASIHALSHWLQRRTGSFAPTA